MSVDECVKLGCDLNFREDAGHWPDGRVPDWVESWADAWGERLDSPKMRYVAWIMIAKSMLNIEAAKESEAAG